MHDNGSETTDFTIKQANWCLFFVLLGYMAVDFVQAVLTGFFGIRFNMDVSIFTRMAAIVPVIIFAFSKRKRIASLRFAKTAPGNVAVSAALAFFVYLLSTVVLTYLAGVIIGSGGSIPQNEIINYILSGSAVTAFLFFSVYAPFTEEIFLRGVFQNAYGYRVGFFAVILTGIVFGLMHADLLSSVNGVIAGIVICYIYYRTRSIWNTIAFHAVFNLLGYTQAADTWVVNYPWMAGVLPMETMDTANPAYQVYTLGILAVAALVSYVLLRWMKDTNGVPAMTAAQRKPRERFEMVPFILASVLLAGRLALGTAAYFIS
jgi:membrane protease YdiL (CAAX protease family)